MTFGEFNAVQTDQANRSMFRDVLSRTAVFAVTGTLALFGGEATINSPVAHADNCTTTVNGDTTSETCVSDDGSTTTTSSNPNSAPLPASPQPTETSPTPVSSPPPKPKKHSSSPSAPRLSHDYTDLNMHSIQGELGAQISADGCGVISLTDDIRYETGNKVKATTVAQQISHWWDRGVIHDVHDSHGPDNYMTGAAAHIAKIYHLEEYETDFTGAEHAIKLGGSAIMLAANDVFTDSSHYMALQKFANGRFQDFDPNQPGHGNDKTWWTPQSLLNNGVQSRVWVFLPRNPNI